LNFSLFIQMTKRSASKQINNVSNDQDSDSELPTGIPLASEQVLKTRVIKPLKRRGMGPTPSSSTLFPFGNTELYGKDGMQFGSMVGVAPPHQTTSTTTITTEPYHTPSISNAIPELLNLKSLNHSFLEMVQKHVGRDSVVDLSLVCKEYIGYRSTCVANIASTIASGIEEKKVVDSTLGGNPPILGKSGFNFGEPNQSVHSGALSSQNPSTLSIRKSEPSLSETNVVSSHLQNQTESGKPLFTVGEPQVSKTNDTSDSCFGTKPQLEMKDNDISKPVFTFATRPFSGKKEDVHGFSFGVNTATTSSTDKPAFSFGTQSQPGKTSTDKPAFTTTSSTDKPAFSFGAQSQPGNKEEHLNPVSTSTDKPSISIGADSPTGKKEPVSFSFGGNSTTSTGKPVFSFGTTTATSSADKPAFSFGTQQQFGKKEEVATTSTTDKPAFSFGTQQQFGKKEEVATTSTTDKPAFSFGTPSQSGKKEEVATTSSTDKPAFSFGTPSQSGKKEEVATTSSTDKPAFSFGTQQQVGKKEEVATTSSTDKPAFSFGTQQQVGKKEPAPFSFGSTSSTSIEKPTFAFGKSSNITGDKTSVGVSFGQTDKPFSFTMDTPTPLTASVFSQPPKDQNEQEESIKEEEEEAKDDQVLLTRGEGEEKEETKVELKSKVFVKNESQGWDVLGVGNVKVNVQGM
jgi:hypothetical protein